MEEKGIQAWWDVDAFALELMGAEEDADKYEKLLDALDVWFDSV
ncbi:hypothetical protein O9993_07705 [Vibrio lentus]|nr:hypothetical protein [Vibrio lentus]